MDRNDAIKISFDYILRLEDAITRDIKVPYGDHSGKFFSKEELLRDLEYCYTMLHKSLGDDYDVK